MKFGKWLALVSTALCVSLSPLAAPAATDKVVIGDIDDLSGVYADVIGPKAVEAIKMAIADFGGSVLGQAGRDSSPTITRTSPTSRAAKFREFVERDGVNMVLGGSNTGVSLAMAGVAKQTKTPFIADRRGGRLAHRQGLQRLYGALRLRHDLARQRHCDDDARSGRQDLVLPHRRLRLRHPVATGGEQRRHRRRRQGAGRRARAAGDVGLFVVPAAGAEFAARRCSASPTPAATPSTRSRPPTSSASPIR